MRLDATFLLVPLLFFSTNSAYGLDEALAAVLLGSAGIFLSILLHEMGHALTAKRH